MLPFIFEVFLS